METRGLVLAAQPSEAPHTQPPAPSRRPDGPQEGLPNPSALETAAAAPPSAGPGAQKGGRSTSLKTEWGELLLRDRQRSDCLPGSRDRSPLCSSLLTTGVHE